MERFSSRGIDELGKIVLHFDIRQRLGLESGDKVSLTPIDNLINLRKAADGSEADCFASQMDHLRRIELIRELRQKFDWKEKDRVAVYNTDKIVILKSASWFKVSYTMRPQT